MAKALWQGQVLAASDAFETVEGNIYFPPDAVDRRFFKDSETTTVCGWKGTAHYFTLAVNGAENPDAAWYYPDPKPAAGQIRNYVAFWRGVTVEQ
ncbi:MAG TPA: DUF427 domain-containing protein [Caulobacteraceae bacterium]